MSDNNAVPPIQPVKLFAEWAMTHLFKPNYGEMLLKKGILVIDDFLSHEEVLICRHELQRLDFAPTRQPKTIRTDNITWIHENQNFNSVNNDDKSFLPELVKKIKAIGCMFENVLGKLEAPSRCMVSMYKNINIITEQDNNNDDNNEKIINEMTTGNLRNNGYRAHLDCSPPKDDDLYWLWKSSRETSERKLTSILYLNDVMDIVMAFCGEHERILTSALEIIHRRNMYEQNVKARLDEGQWGIDSSNNDISLNSSNNNISNINDSLNESTNTLNEAAYQLAYEANEKVKTTRIQFTNKFVAFMNLAEKGSRSHGQNLHFLTFRMDFNEFYDEAKREAMEKRAQTRGGANNADNDEDQPAFEERLLRQLGASGAGYISRQNSLDSDLASNDLKLSAPPNGKSTF